MSYETVLARLKRYGAKRLTTYVYRGEDGYCCAIGAAFPSMRRLGADNTAGVLAVMRRHRTARRNILRSGMTVSEAHALQRVNDATAGREFPETRYLRVVLWLEAQVKKERRRAKRNR